MNWTVPKNQLDTLFAAYGDMEDQYAKRRTLTLKIREVGKALKITAKAIALAQTLFMRYYMYKPLDNQVDVMISAALFLSIKLEDCHVELDVLKKTCCSKLRGLSELNDYSLFLGEKTLLVGINFVLNIETPYSSFDKLHIAFSIPSSVKMDAWKFIGDLCVTHVVLTHPSFTIALIALCYAAKQHRMDVKYDVTKIRAECEKMLIAVPEESQKLAGTVHLIEFFGIQSEYVQEATNALNALYAK